MKGHTCAAGVCWRGMVVAVAVLLPASPAYSQASSPSVRPKVPATSAAKPQAAGSFEALAKRATAAREADRIGDAIGLYKQALQLRPAWDEGWWYLGTLYYDADHYAEALEPFRRLVELKAKFGPGWAMLGLCEFETHDYKNSLIHLQRGGALGLQGNEELVNVARYHAGLLMNLRGDFEGATRMIASLVERGVRTEDVKVALGLALLRVPLLPSQVDPSKDALVHAAGDVEELIAVSNFDQADTAFRNLIKDYPNTPFVHYAYGSMLAGLSRYEEAEKQFKEEIQITPESSMPYLQLAFIELRLRRVGEALPLAEKAIQISPHSFVGHYLLGRALLEQGKVQPSIEELETARKLGPFSPEVRYSLAQAYARARRKTDAERERAEFTRLNTLLEREQRLSGGKSYRTSGDRGHLEPHEVTQPAESSPP